MLGRIVLQHVTSATDGEIDIVTSASQGGFNSLDLLDASRLHYHRTITHIPALVHG